MQRIYFIASYPRSGNTWVRAVIYELLRRRGVFNAPANDLRRIDDFVPTDIKPGFYAQLTGLRPEAITPEIAAPVRARVQHALAQNSKLPLFVKTHAAYGLFGGFPTFDVSVTRGAVYLVRNPVDVAASLAKFMQMDLAEIVRVMMNDTAAQPSTESSIWEPWSSWAVNVQSWMGARDFPILVVRYEDLRADPVQAIARIARHAGIPASTGEIAAVTSELTLERMAEMVKTGTLVVPSAIPGAVFVGSQLEERTADAETILSPLRTHASETLRRLGYVA